MAVRGEIVVECDVDTCHAELVIDAQRVWDSRDITHEVWDAEWKVNREGRTERVICEQCTEEGKR